MSSFYFLYYVAALSSQEMVFENNSYDDHTYCKTSVEEKVVNLVA